MSIPGIVFMPFSVICARLSFSWPDRTSVFDGLDFTFGTGRTGLIGANGSGKSTLLRLVAGELTNNLDLASVRQLAQALSAYRGALIVAGHDLPFLESIGIARWLSVGQEGLTASS
ncbi:ATPase subunit of ABC transporter with duplicated ATPase domains [Planotetraspora sp. GP83]